MDRRCFGRVRPQRTETIGRHVGALRTGASYRVEVSREATVGRGQIKSKIWPNGSLCKTLILLLVLVSGSAPTLGWAEGRGSSVVVIYNSKLPESKALAEYYALRRQVPTNRLFGFDLPTAEAITRREFQERLRERLLQRLVKEKLVTLRPALRGSRGKDSADNPVALIDARVRYAVLCYGVPLRIEEEPNWKEEGIERVPFQLRKNEAAVDSELALLPVRDSRLTLLGPFPNPGFAVTNATSLHPTNGILMVARLDGPSAEIVRGLIDKALQAEKDGLWGRGYFDARGLTNGSTKVGDDWIKGAAEVSRRMGFETVLDSKDERFSTGFPMSQIAFYAGWYEYDGQVSGPFARSAVEFMPGAFAYHLHSFSAQTVRSAKQNWVGPLLDRGVTATMGCVHEPFLEFTPNLAVFFHRLVALGFSLGEAAYACQAYLSWQTTVVGDPLYRPFGRSARSQHEDLILRRSKSLEWWHLKAVNMSLASDVPAEELIKHLEQTPEVEQSAVLLEKLGDLCSAATRFADAIAAYRKAVPQASSPQQKVRVMLELGHTLELSGAPEDAYAVYREFVRTFPDYPDLLALYRKLALLAENLKRPEERDQYQKEIERLSSNGRAGS